MENKDVLNKVLNSIFDGLRSSIVEFSHNDRPSWEACPPEHLGCGVAVEYKGRHFVVTAAHVVAPYANKNLRDASKTVDDYDSPEEAFLSLDNIGFYLNNYFYTLDRVIFDNNPAGIIDVGVVCIPEDTATEWGDSVKFLKVEDFHLKAELDTHPNYYICGYPNCWVDLDIEGEKIIRRPFQFVTNGVYPDEDYQLRYDSRYNILLSYDKSKIKGEKHEGELLDFYPQGISGCGVWHRSTNGEYKLAGIMTEDKTMKENAPLMMATKMDVVLMMLEDTIKILDEESKD